MAIASLSVYTSLRLMANLLRDGSLLCPGMRNWRYGLAGWSLLQVTCAQVKGKDSPYYSRITFQ